MKQKVRVAHVLASGDLSAKGIAQTATNLAEGLDRSRFELSALFLREGGAIAESMQANGVDTGVIGWRGTLEDLAGAIRFASALNRGRFDIVHLHSGGLAPRFVARSASRARIVAHFHSLVEENPVRTVRKRSAALTDLVIANSAATARTVTGATPLVIHPGVKAPGETCVVDRPGDSCRIGVASRLVSVKGIADLITAVGALNERGESVDLDIAGTGPEQASLREHVALLGINDRVTFRGWIADIGSIMRSWSIYAHPSHTEGFGFSVLEAMAYGLPVVATAVGGVPEVVVDNETGFLVPPRDSGAFADRLAGLLRSPQLRGSMGARGRERAIAQFSADRETAQLQAAYERLLA